MKLPLTSPLLCGCLGLVSLGGFQDETPAPAIQSAPLPDDVAAMIDDEVISLEAYKDYLLSVYGSGPLEDLILTRLLEREATRAKIEISPEELDAKLESFWESYLVRFRGDENALRQELSAAGFTPDTYRNKVREETRRNLLESRILLATREISEDALRTRFEQRYGVGGVKVEVRHILFTSARARADMRRRGASGDDLHDEHVSAEIQGQIEAVRARLGAGEAFEAVARTQSHDTSVHQNGGVIPGYNYSRYGEALAAAVRSAEVGVVAGPIETGTGWHLLEVVSRVTTTLGEVSQELTARLLAEPPSWQERNALRRRLREEASVRTFR